VFFGSVIGFAGEICRTKPIHVFGLVKYSIFNDLAWIYEPFHELAGAAPGFRGRESGGWAKRTPA
jgi:hypothetical protein